MPDLPRPTVTAPTPVPLGFGLLSAATEKTSADAHARAGVEYETITGLEGGVAAVTLGRPTGTLVAETFDEVAFQGQLPRVRTDPFAIYAGAQAKPVGLTIADLQARANQKLQLSASHWIETGCWAALRALATVHPETAAPVDPDIAIGLLEEWIALNVGAQGVIHTPRRGVAGIGKHTAASGPRQQTKLGTPVAFGSGYSNVAPDGTAAAAGTVWAYATGPVLVTRSGVEPLGSGPETMNLRSNTATVYALEVVSVGIEVGAVAVPVKFEVES